MRRREVQSVRALDAETFEHAVGNHRLGPALAFFGRLEQKANGPRDLIAPGGDEPCRAEQNRDMTVVAAGVHVYRRLGTVRYVVLIGKPSMSARNMIVLPARVPRTTPTTPV